MISPKDFYDKLVGEGIDCFTGVPDSLLKDFCSYLTDHAENHVITPNEGNAIGLAAGHYLATKNPALVYMQNSGQGNAINPLASLADPDVYSIPMLLLIGWRGEPKTKDEPQHVRQGKITLGLLDTLRIHYEVLPDEPEDIERSLETAIRSAKEREAPYALIVKKGTFESYTLQREVESSYTLSREDAIRAVVDSLKEDDIVVSTTGKTSRELFEYRESLGQGHERDFLTVGSMGHVSSIALGIAKQKTSRNVYCFDGDGAILMHMGALAMIGTEAPSNFRHIVFNNGVHDSVGGQETSGFKIDITAIARSSRYKTALRAEDKEDLPRKLAILGEGPSLLEIRVKKGAREGLGRPTTTPQANKEAFMENLQND